MLSRPLEKIKQYLLDLPISQKLMRAFLVSVCLPLLIAALCATWISFSYTGQAAFATVSDKLNIGGLILENTRMELLNVGRTSANDNLVVVNYGLGIPQAIAEYLENIRSSQSLDFALVLDRQGQVIASARQGGNPPPGQFIVSQAACQSAEHGGGICYFTRLGAGRFLQEEGLVLADPGRELSILALVPIREANGQVLGFTACGLVIGAKVSSGVKTTREMLSKRLAVPFLLADDRQILYFSAGSSEFSLGKDHFLADSSTPKWQTVQARQLGGTVYLTQFQALLDETGQAVAAFGIALPESSVQIARNITLLMVAGVGFLAFGISWFMAWDWPGLFRRLLSQFPREPSRSLLEISTSV